MAGRIPQDFIDELIARADIIDVVGSRVQLKKAGREYKACCPFHNEKTPSFTVSPEKGFYHCFGCGAHGTALGFLMDYERLEFVDAVEELAQLLGLDVPREASAETRSPVAPVLEIMGAAAKLYQQALREHPMAVDYPKGRGIDGERARDFGIGYAPAGWDFLLQRLGDGDDRRRLLQAGGLITAREGGGFYDRFRDRIMFPIRDGRGRTQAQRRAGSTLPGRPKTERCHPEYRPEHLLSGYQQSAQSLRRKCGSCRTYQRVSGGGRRLAVHDRPGAQPHW